MRSTLLVVALATLAACAESPTNTADHQPNFAQSGDALGGNGLGPVVGSASGSGHALCTPDGADCRAEVGGETLLERYGLEAGDLALRTFSLNARLKKDGTVRGKARFNNRGRPQAWGADIECMLFRSAAGKPNQVWMLGTLTRGFGQASDSPSPFPYVEGARVLFAVEDNGEGSHATPDRLVGFATVPEGQYQALCPLFNQQVEPFNLDGFFAAFSFATIRGNIQVRPPSAD